MDLIVVHPGVKINGSYYHDMLLSQQLLPMMCDASAISSSFNKTCSAPAHRAVHATLCNFLNSQHPLSFLQICGRRIAPIGYKIWGDIIITDIQQRVHQSQLCSIDELKNRMLDAWHGMDQSVIIDDAIDRWCKCLILLQHVYGQKADILSNCCKV